MTCYRDLASVDSIPPFLLKGYRENMSKALEQMAVRHDVTFPGEQLMVRDGIPSDFGLPYEHEEWRTPLLSPRTWTSYIRCCVPAGAVYCFYGIAVEEWPCPINAFSLYLGLNEHTTLGRWNIQRMNARLTSDRLKRNYRFRREAWLAQPIYFKPLQQITLKVHNNRDLKDREVLLPLLWMVAEVAGRTAAE